MLDVLFPWGSAVYPFDSFVSSNSIDNPSNALAILSHSDLAAALGGYVTNIFPEGAKIDEIIMLHRAISNLSVSTWAATNATLAFQNWGNYTYAGNRALRPTLGLERRSITNTVMQIVYYPGSTNAGNLGVNVAGYISDLIVYSDNPYTNEDVTLVPYATQSLTHVYLSPPMAGDGMLSFGLNDEDNIALTVNSGTVNTGDQVVVYLDRMDLYTVFRANPFWNTRNTLNALYLMLDEMRCCILPGGWSFLDGYIGRDETDDLAYSNRTQQTGMAFSLDGGGTGYGRLALWNGPVWSGTYNIYPSSNEWNYATLWAATNRVFQYWTGQAWEMQYRWTNSAPAFGGTFDDNGLGYTQDVFMASAWLAVTNAAMVFPETMGSTNPASITPDSERGFRATVPTLLLRLDTDTNFICTPR
jgi:hypothetical protein